MIIADCRMPENIIYHLKDHCEKIIPSAILKNVKTPEATHPDMQIHFVSSTYAICAPETYKYYRYQLPSYIELLPGIYCPSGTYPADCAYNVARVGNMVLYNPHSADPRILDYYREKCFRMVSVRQGYTKCNVCPISNAALITEDVGIHNTIIANQLSIEVDSCCISAGGVRLEGYPYGFIGGATGMAEGRLLICGSLSQHPEGDMVKKFLAKHHCEYIELENDEIRDFGSIIWVT